MIEVLYLFGKVGANTFILISGYFFDKTKFSWRKVFNLWLLIQFYTILSILVKVFAFHETFKLNGIKELIRLLFPLTFGKYWFVSAYVLIYIFSPYIKVWVLSLSKKDFTKMICLFIGIWSIWSTAVGVINSDITNLVFYHQYFWLFIMYMCGIYIKMYGIPLANFSNIQLLLLNILVYVMNAGYIGLYHLFPKVMNKIGFSGETFFWRENSVLCFAGSIFLFLFLSKLNIKKSEIINRIATTTFGIYLLHDGLLQNNIWQDLVHVNKYMDSWFCIPYIFISSIFVFGVCSLIDYIRQILVKYIKTILLHKI